MTTSVIEDFDMGQFYSEQSFSEWQQIIGNELHYHFGYFDADEDLETGLRQTVRNFYPFIEAGSHVLDLGCGWGGPAQLLIKEKHCHLEGITISSSQLDYCRKLGMNTRCQNVEREALTGQYDTIFMLEVLCHIFDKNALLKKLRPLAPQLVLSTVCCSENYAGDSHTFGDSIKLISVSELTASLEAAGWRVKFTQNRRFKSLRTVALWHENLNRIYGDSPPPGQLAVLKSLTDIAMSNPVEWSTMFPLIDIVAE